MTREAGVAALKAALPQLGRHYAAERNTAPGPDDPPTTSRLSPWLRRRLITEQDVIEAAVAAHGMRACEKFVHEVFWRTYFKGYLEQHPQIWSRYRQGLSRARDLGGIQGDIASAQAGTTGIACFDAWAHALRETGWLHNHERMWFASIWIFTLRLPWELGAAFFEHELIDYDPASNTLSWRWVAGLHTRGKHYVARADNIARYTQGRFDPAGQLDEAPAPLEEAEPPAAIRAPVPGPMPEGRSALLLHEDDLSPESMILPAGIGQVAIIRLPSGSAPRQREASAAACEDALHRAGSLLGLEATLLTDPAGIMPWAAGLPVVTPYAPAGPIADALATTPAHRLLRAWDAQWWPFCSRGFFKLRAQVEAGQSEGKARQGRGR